MFSSLKLTNSVVLFVTQRMVELIFDRYLISTDSLIEMFGFSLDVLQSLFKIKPGFKDLVTLKTG